MPSIRPEIPQNGPEPIAIVGVGCRLPGNITSIETLLEALQAGRDLITEIPADRWNVDTYYDPDSIQPAKTYVRKGGFVDDIDRFDAGFFGISDAEAPRMDPQHRLVLQTVWHAIENAGQSPDELVHSNTGVFLAMMNTNNYSQMKGAFEGLAGITGYDAMSDAMSIAAGRISHFLGLEGPSITLDTACSGSMVALHLARQSILAGEIDTALVAGVNAILHPGIHIAFSKLGLMSRTGRCAAFDASADGYIRGEGCVAVVLRRQSQAIARGDRVLASILGTAINQDGHTPAVTAPNGRAQEKVMRSAMARLGISPDEIGYVEAHGTGTPVGDPIEMAAIANVYGPGRRPEKRLFVGSVKSNFGHIEAGAGLLGVIKAGLSLQQEQIFRSLHFRQWNPNIELGHAPIEVPTATVPWPRSSDRRLAGVNSFGYSGTNAHAILQEPPLEMNGHAGPEKEAADRSNEMLVISAKAKNSLEELADRWVEYLGKEDPTPLPDIAFTAATGRSHMKYRLAAVGSSKAEIAGKLRTWREGRVAKGLASGQTRFRQKPKTAFLFTGQGAQHPGMGAKLYASERHFAETIDRVSAIMDVELGSSLKDVLFSAESRNYLGSTRYAQPALFAIEYALADLLRHWGIEPDFVIGHSVGEITAACIAGVLTLEDAIRFVVARGRLMGGLPEGGKMVAIGTDVEHCRQWIRGRESEVSVAGVNGPGAVVISGKAEAVEAIVELAREAGLRATPLEVSHAFHSPLMDPILDELERVAGSMRIAPAKIPVVSNVTGEFYADNLDARYWSRHVREAVLFHAGMGKIVDAGASLMVEIGPHPALTPAVATSFDANRVQPVPTLKRDGKDFANLLGALAQLYAGGSEIQFDRLFWNPRYRRVSLPLYPFRRDQHWVVPVGLLTPEPNAPAEKMPDLPSLHPLLGVAVGRSSRRTVFQAVLSVTSPWTDHRVLGNTVFPGTAYLDMAVRGFAAISGQTWRPVVLRDVAFERPLILAYRKPKSVSLMLDRESPGAEEVQFVIASAENKAEVYCRGRMLPADTAPEQSASTIPPHERIADTQIGSFYGDLRKIGLEYGAKFANVRELWLGAPGSGEARGRIAPASLDEKRGPDPFLNVVLLDSCLHVFGAAMRGLDHNGQNGAFVPASIEKMTFWKELPVQVWSQLKVNLLANGLAAVADILVLNDAGEILAEFKALELRPVSNLSAGKAVKSTGTGLTNKSRAELVEILRPLPKAQQVKELARWLAAEIKDTMGQAADGWDVDSLPASTAFLEIGLDSLLVTELQRRIQQKLEFRFQPMQGLDYQRIDSMSEYLLNAVLAPSLQQQAVAAGTLAIEQRGE